MYMWFFEDTGRLERERRAVEQLAAANEWLAGTEWGFDAGLCLDAVIRVHGHDYSVRMAYPNLFPSVPPTVLPLNAQERWSSHQYGSSDGPLCLEWGPDNWHPEVTGAQLLESAYNLLNIENPLGRAVDAALVVAPSRHQLTNGQEVRSRKARFFVGPTLVSQLYALPAGTSGTFQFSTHPHNKSWVALVHAAESMLVAETMTDDSVPATLSDEDELKSGNFYRISSKLESVSSVDTLQELQHMLAGDGFDLTNHARDEDLDSHNISQRPLWILIIDSSGTAGFFVAFADGDVLPFARVQSAGPDTTSRLPGQFKDLAARSVGIVGLGSVGSKIALSLARMGVLHLLLVDYDIFLPENVQRHVLDWSNIGEHKVEALREMLLRVNPSMKVEVSDLHLTGQENSALVSRMLDKLSDLDLLIDATAEPAVFNIMSAIAVASKKPLVWAQVYAGGFGGMIARSRPELDPNPQTMRLIYSQYCLEHPVPDEVDSADYTTEDSQGMVFTATDADVAVIASHVARLAADCLLSSATSTFPHSMYLIGLGNWWVFKAPFHTIPISTQDFSEPPSEETSTSREVLDGANFVLELLEKKLNATPASS